MKFRIWALLCLAVALVAGPSASEAAGMFGNDEEIHRIQDVDVTGQDGEALFLGYKTTTLFIIGGVYITDDGYVYGVRDDSTKYIETTPEEIAKFQEAGLLPKPLPPYELSTMDYVIGYSLWVIVLPILVIYFAFVFLKKKKAPPVASPPGA